MKPILGITMGDPAGIGPEVAIKALEFKRIHQICRPVIIGNSAIIERERVKYSPQKRINRVKDIHSCSFSSEVINVFEVEIDSPDEIVYGTISSRSGDAAFRTVKKVIELAMKGDLDATVTGPIHKRSINDAGHHFSGHTEIYAHFTGTEKYAMLLASEKLNVIHVTTHVSMRQACDMITKDLVLEKIILLHEGLIKMGTRNPRIGIAGLNPHAGDEGLFGDEDEANILPAIQAARTMGIIADGPVPADTLFPKALAGHYDGCVVMYHDQGHIPFKLLGFTWDTAEKDRAIVSGVNITLGLPIIRTSVDHGTAFDIAGKGIASADAMVESIEYAVMFASNK